MLCTRGSGGPRGDARHGAARASATDIIPHRLLFLTAAARTQVILEDKNKEQIEVDPEVIKISGLIAKMLEGTLEHVKKPAR